MKIDTPVPVSVNYWLFQEGAAGSALPQLSVMQRSEGKDVLRGSAVGVRQLDGLGHCAFPAQQSVRSSLFLAGSPAGDTRAQPQERGPSGGTTVIAGHVWLCGWKRPAKDFPDWGLC